MRRKRILIAAIVLAAAAVVLSAVIFRRRAVVLTGIVATDDVIVGSEVLGRLQELKVAEGDTVTKGEHLAQIQPDEWRADLSYYEASERQLAAQVEQAEADLRYQEQQTEAQILQAKANLASAQDQVAQAEADQEIAKLTFERQDALFAQGTNSAQDHDQARTSLDGANARVASLKKQVAAAAAALALAQAGTEEDAARRDALEAERRQLAAAAAQAAKARTYLDYADIRAPIDGIVDVRAARQGEVVSAGQPILTLVNPDDLWVRVDVEEGMIDRIRIGDRMTVRLPSGDEREGTVFYRGVDADYATERDVSRTKRDIKTFEVRLRCDNRDRALALGMSAYVVLPR
jgi:multidrug resistance efflux pump